ncbi:DUF4157 domain-containing protein [Dolichospermum sp. FACHB-1091]|uniref:eCIS core domain-containing protein n=1 Tax=Dolichospermum sp. FACHB-1091 TaxID=2692798 RepID=UPI00168031C4|nr:DUF4157 domain-containing protein [Dolichospermum sp. FACHB-1091]MBD2442708.1 DUF4157 domain-containing protein [Dolichospermum sp. FACHB-1091]
MVQTRLHKHSLSKAEQAVSNVASRASVRDPIDEFQEVYGSRAASAAFRQQLGSDFSSSPQIQPPIQAKPSFRGLSQELAAESQPVQLREEENKTGLPDDLKAGVESLSGFSLDDVRVHYNSSKPAQLQALAYTQGTEIHVGPGQEKHLAHEAWHVVQQMQGRVKPTMQMKGVQINDDEGLEREAEKKGKKILQKHWPKHVTNLLTQKKCNVKQCFWKKSNRAERHEDNKQPTSMHHSTVQCNGLMLTDRPWEEIQELESSLGSQFVKTNLSHIPKKEQMLRSLLNPKNLMGDASNQIVVAEVADWTERLDLAVTAIGIEWQNLGGDPNKPKEEYECSGADWNINDEGADVSRDLLKPEYRSADPEYEQKIFIAYIPGDFDPIAVMIVEMRKEDKQSPNLTHRYIRWLLGHPKKKGGGSALVRTAKEIATHDAQGELRVDSAKSAESWYQKQGFQTLYASKHEIKKACGCKFMKWSE